MWKRFIAAVGSIFILWMIIDWGVVHGILLRPAFESTAKLWKPMGAVEMVLGLIVTLFVAICFVWIYACLIKPKSISTGLKYGFLTGLLIGIWICLAVCYSPLGFGRQLFAVLALFNGWVYY